jgi:hypothetical protein
MRVLDKALRDALAMVPRDDVVQHVAAALADQREVRRQSLGKLLDELEAEHGTVPEAIRDQTRRMWPNYEEGK